MIESFEIKDIVTTATLPPRVDPADALYAPAAATLRAAGCKSTLHHQRRWQTTDEGGTLRILKSRERLNLSVSTKCYKCKGESHHATI
jgi:hypothetical protein